MQTRKRDNRDDSGSPAGHANDPPVTAADRASAKGKKSAAPGYFVAPRSGHKKAPTLRCGAVAWAGFATSPGPVTNYLVAEAPVAAVAAASAAALAASAAGAAASAAGAAAGAAASEAAGAAGSAAGAGAAAGASTGAGAGAAAGSSFLPQAASAAAAIRAARTREFFISIFLLGQTES